MIVRLSIACALLGFSAHGDLGLGALERRG